MLGLDLPDQLDPIHPGQPPVRQDEIHVVCLQRVERLLRTLDREHVVALELQRPVERPEKDFIVVDQQEPLLHRSPPAREWARTAAGSEIRTRVPFPGSLSTTTSPP